MNVYDFDETIYPSNSTVDFCFWCMNRHPKLFFSFFPKAVRNLILRKRGKIPEYLMQRRFFSYLTLIDDFDEQIERFWDKNEKKIAAWYLAQKRPDDLIISASPGCIIEPIAKRLGVNFIATEYDREYGVFLNNIMYAKGKAKYIIDHGFPVIENFYSDSLSDTPLALCAEKAYLVTNKASTVIDWPDLDAKTMAEVKKKIDTGWNIHLKEESYLSEKDIKMKDHISLSTYQRGFLSKIIAIPSVGGDPEEGAPYGRNPRKVLQTFLDEAKTKGFRTGIEGGRVGWVEFGEGDKLFGIICHLDVVPAGDGWDSDPFTLDFRTDEAGWEAMYGRGIVDDKGPACAAFFAMLELADEGRIPDDYRVRLILGTDEERGCSCIQYYAGHGQIPDFSITPDSIFPVTYCEKGILRMNFTGENKHDLNAHGGSAVNIVPASATCEAADKTITVSGKAAHASLPELGINAIELLAEAMDEQGIDLSEYPVMKFVRDFDANSFTGCNPAGDYGSLSHNIGMLSAGKDGCELQVDFRIPWDADQEAVIDNLTKKASEYGLETLVTVNLPSLLKDKNAPEVRMLTDIWVRHIDQFTGFKESYRDIHAEPKIVGAGTYARFIPNTIAFGIQAPWWIDQCHQANEHVAVTDFLQWIQILKEYITEAGKQTSN